MYFLEVATDRLRSLAATRAIALTGESDKPSASRGRFAPAWVRCRSIARLFAPVVSCSISSLA